MDIVVTHHGSFVQVTAAAGLLDSQVVFSAIEYLKVTLERRPCGAALLEFAAPRQKLQLWELPGRWRGVFAGFRRFVRVAYVISGKAFDGNADLSSYFNHNGDVSGKLFHNCRDAIEWLDQYDVSRVPSLVRSQRVITLDNETLKVHPVDSSMVNQRKIGPRHTDDPTPYRPHDS